MEKKKEKKDTNVKTSRWIQGILLVLTMYQQDFYNVIYNFIRVTFLSFYFFFCF